MWAVTLTYKTDLDEHGLFALACLLEEKADASLANLPGCGVTVTVFETGPDPIKAARMASERISALVPAQLYGVEVLPDDVYIARADAPTLPPVVSSAEAADILSVSRQRVHQLRMHPRFPKPLFELRTGPIWAQEAIERFAEVWDRRPGRRSGVDWPQARVAPRGPGGS